MNKQTFLKAALLISVLGTAPLSAQTSGRADGLRFVPAVEDQLVALTERADALGLNIGTSPNPSSCRHYQAITRVDGADGTPFFLITRSGNTPDTPGFDELNCDDSPGETRNGHLIVFRMGSREKHGERMRSNRLRKGVHVNSTPPPFEDRATNYFTIVGGNPNDPDPAKRPGLVPGDGEGSVPQRVYQHPGGMQLIGHMLAIAIETPRQFPLQLCESFPIPEFCAYDRAPDPTQIMFFDVSDPQAPVFKSQFAPINSQGQVLAKAGVVAITPLPGGRYLMMTTGGSNSTWFFYRSRSNDLSSVNLEWDLMRSIPGHDVEDAHQTLQFLREGDMNGALYLAGSRGHAVFGDRDRLDLYRVECDTPDCAPGEQIELTVVRHGRRITPNPSTGGNRLVNLAAAGGFHVTPSGELIFYATEHDNDGPGSSVKAGEWRHDDMVREGSPTYLPAAVVNGPYQVDEGRTVSMTGSAGPPITKAWIQLFHDTEFRSFYPVVDYADYDRDDFDDFATLEFLLVASPPQFLSHNDKARSWRWFAPAGCSIRAIDHGDGQSNLPETRTLVGDGLLHHDPDLTLILNDAGTDNIDREVDAVDFSNRAPLTINDCDQYYAGPYDLQWDLDINSSYETTGSAVTFNALRFDGPAELAVPAQAQHRSGGPVGQTTARVSVRNVAPQLTPLLVTDSAGQEVNAAVPFVLTGLLLTAGAGFSDPGVLDHQTATLAWGDGSVEPHTAFTTFDEAFGDATGAVSHTHRYPLAGSYTIALSVVDDDGGAGLGSTVVRVVTPEQALQKIIVLLDSAIASATNKKVRDDLEKARKALAGSNGQSNNGALSMIKAGNDQAAIAFLNQALDHLRQAQAGGANVATLIALLEQVKAALLAG